MAQLVDNFQRTIRQLRVSVTGDCNLGCIYCHNEGNPYTGQWLTPEEIGRISAVGHRLGINKFRLTGGEPLLREDLAEIFAGPH